MSSLYLVNSLTNTKEKFIPLNAPHVGMYVCGPTVYGPAHLGHARPYITFDVLYRYLRHLDYKVRYVRNITDVGHLEDELEGEGEDRILKRARLEQLEPMEVAKMFTDEFHRCMQLLNTLPPSIEPQASGHIIEQIEMIKMIMANGYAYESNGSVYFDVVRYAEKYPYGELSGRVMEELIAGAGNERRTLEGQEEKRHPADFALWKKAPPGHIMQWPSPWGYGFPGWHIECSAMSRKYLGETFDIHGGGMDLLFPHHESEIAQSKGCCGLPPVRFWLHNNLVTINGQKMGRSLNNFINLDQFFTGNHPLLQKAYSPMTIRFYMLQAHYRSTIDFSNQALQAAEKALARLINSYRAISRIRPADRSSVAIEDLRQKCYDAMNDDLNTAIVLVHLFEAARLINSAVDGNETMTATDIENVKKLFDDFLFSILGIKEEKTMDDNLIEGLMNLVLSIRQEARARKDFATSDRIREELLKLNFEIKDGKEGVTWSRN